MAREVVRNIQDARKQLNCEISDKIMLKLDGNLSKKSKEYICNETLGSLQKFENADFECDVNSNNMKVSVKIKLLK